MHSDTPARWRLRRFLLSLVGVLLSGAWVAGCTLPGPVGGQPGTSPLGPPVGEPAMRISLPAAVATHAPVERGWEVTQVTLDVYSGRPNPVWQLSQEQDGTLRALIEGLAEVDCRPMDLQLGYRGFVVFLGQRPELSNEYRVRVYDGQVRFGEPWALGEPATCLADPARQVEHSLLETGRAQLDPAMIEGLAQEIGVEDVR